jgi:hypothetical protein
LSFTRSVVGGVVLTGVLGAALAALSTTILGTYGWALFMLTPFVLGFVAARLHVAGAKRTLADCVTVALAANALAVVLLVAVALEGAICIVMALPLALPVAALGAYVAYLGQRDRWAEAPERAVAALVIAVPLLMGIEAGADREPPSREVTTSVVIDAPPEAVWRHVIAFPPLPKPRSAPFRLGIAYPTSATLTGRGVGAVRRCRFTTGDFVEPITVWDPPRRLAFSVRSQPAPMKELSPWGEVHAPHLDNFLRSRRGQFGLVALPGGRTRLEGTTWYENRMWPARYWLAWSDEVIGGIHEQVLSHVERLAEADVRDRRRS